MDPGPGNADGECANPVYQGHRDGDQNQMDMGRVERRRLLAPQNAAAAWALRGFLEQIIQ